MLSTGIPQDPSLACIATGHGHLLLGYHTKQKAMAMKPAKSTMTVLKQVVDLIPAYFGNVAKFGAIAPF